MTAVMVYVWLVEGDVGVPLMVHVLLSMDRPNGREGELLQEDAPLTLVGEGVNSAPLCAHNSILLLPSCAEN